MKPTLDTIDDCWNRIGVNGDQSCPQLAGHIHCRNCPVYAGAARRALQRPADEAYRSEWAAHFAAAPAARTAATESVLVLRLGREWLAVPSHCVDACAPLATGHRLPHRSSPTLLGIVSVQGKLTPLVALDVLLGVDGGDGEAAGDSVKGRHVVACLLVLRVDGQRYAMRVAELLGIVRYGAAELGAPPTTVNKSAPRFVRGVLALGPRRVGVLDIALVSEQLRLGLR